MRARFFVTASLLLRYAEVAYEGEPSPCGPSLKLRPHEAGGSRSNINRTDRGRHAIVNPLTLYQPYMSRAIGFAIALVTIAVFVPDVFRSVEALVLKSLVLANGALDALASGGHLVH